MTVHLSLTGVGPIFQADVVTGDKHSLFPHHYSVMPHDCGYKVADGIGIRIRMESSHSGPRSISYGYGDVWVTGTLIAKEGEKVVISKNGERDLGLTLAKTARK